MVRPERRTRADLAAGALIVVAAVVAVFMVWLTSDARATVSAPATTPLGEPAPALTVPDTFTQAWQAPSPATTRPAVAGPAVVTADGSEVLGRDPATGQVRWRYSRNIPLCTVGAAWDHAIAVYRKSHNCSEVTSLQGSTGVRGPQSNSDAEFGTRLLYDGDYVTTTGRRVVESWRSDLVRTQEYGLPVDIINANNNMRRPNCTYASEAVGADQVGLIEKCPGDPGDRVTLIKANPASEETPEEVMTTIVGGSQASVVAVTENRVAVIRRDISTLVVYNTAGTVQGEFPVHLGPMPPPGAAMVEPTTHIGTVYWFTGTDTVALDQRTLVPLWTVPGTLGSGTIYGGKLLLPVPGGIAVCDPVTGALQRVIHVDRHGYTGPVASAAAGNVLLEQRGNTLVALH